MTISRKEVIKWLRKVPIDEGDEKYADAAIRLLEQDEAMTLKQQSERG